MENHPGSRLHWNSVYGELSDLRSPTAQIQETKAKNRGARPGVSGTRPSRLPARSPGFLPAPASAQVSRNPG